MPSTRGYPALVWPAAEAGRDREGARRRAFVATRLATLNQTQKVYNLIQRSLQEGLGLEGFLEELDADTRASASLNYLEAVYRTNIATAHSVGRYRAQTQPAHKTTGRAQRTRADAAAA